MKLKTWLKYLVGFLLFFSIIILEEYILAEITKKQTLFQLNYTALNLAFLLNVVLGGMIGVEYFLKERRKQGRWSFNLAKAVFIILPSLYLSFPFLSLLIKAKSIQNFLLWPSKNIFSGHTTYYILFQVLLGYAIITVFYKKEIEVQEIQPEDKAEKEEPKEEELDLNKVLSDDSRFYYTEEEIKLEENTKE